MNVLWCSRKLVQEQVSFTVVPLSHLTRLFCGCQLVVDTTLVGALYCDGSLRHGAVNVDGVVLQAGIAGSTLMSGIHSVPQTDRVGVANEVGSYLVFCSGQGWPFLCWI